MGRKRAGTGDGDEGRTVGVHRRLVSSRGSFGMSCPGNRQKTHVTAEVGGCPWLSTVGRCVCRWVGGLPCLVKGGGTGGNISSRPTPSLSKCPPPPFVCFVCSSLFSGRASLRHRRRSCASRLCFLFAFDWPGLFVVCQSSLSTTHTRRLLIRFHPRRRFPARRRQTHQTSSYIPSYLVRRSSWLPGERRGGFSNPILQTITTTNPPSYDNPRHEPSWLKPTPPPPQPH